MGYGKTPRILGAYFYTYTALQIRPLSLYSVAERRRLLSRGLEEPFGEIMAERLYFVEKANALNPHRSTLTLLHNVTDVFLPVLPHTSVVALLHEERGQLKSLFLLLEVYVE